MNFRVPVGFEPRRVAEAGSLPGEVTDEVTATGYYGAWGR